MKKRQRRLAYQRIPGLLRQRLQGYADIAHAYGERALPKAELTGGGRGAELGGGFLPLRSAAADMLEGDAAKQGQARSGHAKTGSCMFVSFSDAGVKITIAVCFAAPGACLLPASVAAQAPLPCS
jgi:hypothetical protein